ncbi:hypothetical protein EDD15DRAFT_2201253 [Pisolithus albus]|nr:hypothetical protein EDD15DRAFT_2201253 [Pisolithus albus]
MHADIRVYNIGKSHHFSHFTLSHEPDRCYPTSVSFVLGNAIVCGTNSGKVEIWVPGNKEALQVLDQKGDIIQAVASFNGPHSSIIALGSSQKGHATYISIWRADGGAKYGRICRSIRLRVSVRAALFGVNRTLFDNSLRTMASINLLISKHGNLMSFLQESPLVRVTRGHRDKIVLITLEGKGWHGRGLGMHWIAHSPCGCMMFNLSLCHGERSRSEATLPTWDEASIVNPSSEALFPLSSITEENTIDDLMIEPTHPVMFSILSPPPRGLELERDVGILINNQAANVTIPIDFMRYRMSRYTTRCSDVPSRMLENGKLGLCSNVSHVFLRLIHERNSGVKGEEYDIIKLTDRSTGKNASKMHLILGMSSLDFDKNPVHVLPGTGFAATTSNVTHLPHRQSSNFMHVCPARAFRRHQKAIRSHNDCVSWFSSLNSGPVEAPPPSSDCYSHALQGGDLFVHTHDRGRQAWMWGESGWMPVQEAGSGEPSWVTGKTMATYRSKNRKCFP